MDINEDLKNKVKFKITMSEIIDEEINMKKIKKNINRKSIIAASTFLILTTGVVFAKDIENFVKSKFGLGKGIETAVENGYIGQSENKTKFINSNTSVTNGISEEILDSFNTGVKINNFVITDTALSLEIEMKFDEKINQYKNLGKLINGNIDYENFGHIELNDLFILDEKNKLICSPSYLKSNEVIFDNFCKEHYLDFEYNAFNENYLNSTANCQIQEINPTTNTIKIIYMIQVNEMPKSQYLNLYFNKIAFIPKKPEASSSEQVILNGNWNISLEVPEIMYNRDSNSYNVISCQNKDFDVYTAKVTDTGFEIGIKISNIEKPQQIPQELINPKTGLEYIFNSKEELLEISTDKKFEEMYIEYNEKNWPIRVNGSSVASWIEYTEGCYIENSNGEKFYCSESSTRKQNSKFIDGNKFDFYETFDMTKYDATDTITAVIEVYGKPYKIQLKKI